MTITAGYAAEIRQRPWLSQMPVDPVATLHWHAVPLTDHLCGTSALLSWHLRRQADSLTMPDRLLDCLGRALCALGSLQFLTSSLALLETADTAEHWKQMFASLFEKSIPETSPNWVSTHDSRYRLLSISEHRELPRVLVQTDSPLVAGAAFWSIGRDFSETRVILAGTHHVSALERDDEQWQQCLSKSPTPDMIESLRHTGTQLIITHNPDDSWIRVRAMEPSALNHFHKALMDACAYTGISLTCEN